MATEGRALSMGRIVGGRPRRETRRLAESAFGLLSIALARRAARSGLNGAEPMRDLCGHGLAGRITRASNGDITTVKPDFACPTIRRRPFRIR
jgi:hypothetical protein